MENNTVIYAIVNKVNGHRYIGSALDFEKRKKIHLCQLRKGKHHSQYLQRAYSKYGEDAFDFVILARCSKKELIETEQSHINSLKPEYNVSPTAGSSFGVRRTDEYKKRTSEIQKKRFSDPLQRKAHSDAHLGQVVTKKQRSKISKSLMGHAVTAETRKKISDAQKGIPKSEESKRKMSIAKKGSKMPLSTRKKISESVKRARARNKGG